MDLQIVCQDVMNDVDGSLGCVLADLETGLPLAAEYRPGTIMDANMVTLVSYVGIDLFRGKLVRNFERTLSRTHASPDEFVREVQLTTSNTYQFMSAVPGWDQAIFILVTDKNVSLGMGLLAVHDAVRRLGEMPLHSHSAAPAVSPTLPQREEISEPSTPALEPRQPEPQYNGAIDTPPAPTRNRDFEPPHPQQHERLLDTVARAPVAPAIPSQTPSPEVAPTEPAPPPSEARVPPAAETPAAPEPATEEEHASTGYYRRANVGGSAAEDRASHDVPIGPRARMFFKRSGEDKKKNRRRRS